MTEYYSIPTTIGAAKIAAAANVNEELTITHMAFGDANGLPYLPVTRANSTTLLNERHRVAIEYLNVDSANANVYITKARIPAAVGGFEINEIGLFDSDGDLIYLANYPRTFKPQITQGAGGELNVKIHIMTSHSSVLTIVLNPNVITLTQENGDDRYALKTELDAEATIRASADLALSIALAAEITHRQNADNALLALINSNNTALALSQSTITGDLSNTITLPNGCRSVFVAVNACGGRGGGSGDNGGQGGGAGAGGYLRFNLVGDLSGYVVEYFIKDISGTSPVPPYGSNTKTAIDNPTSWVKIYNPNTGSHSALFFIGTGQTGGQADGETSGGNVSYGGEKGLGGKITYQIAANPLEKYDVFFTNGLDGTVGIHNIAANMGSLQGHGGIQAQGASTPIIGNPSSYGIGGEAGQASNTQGQRGGFGFIRIVHSSGL